ncbi:hypothetical protein GGU11DRAFT_810440 [Lentinula aff. detonsa]|nr:hypothetical protein GGU11DRAFT_810440 [Lentinula aff. detonsa]
MSSNREQDPFERSRVKTFDKMFDKDLEYQWHLDLYKKLCGTDLGDATPGGGRNRRVVVRRWPRAPNGAVIRELPPGYTTPSSTHLWGERLLDFFSFSRGTDDRLNHVVSTSSRLSAWMKANGETEYAKDEMIWANTEEPPRLRPAADIMEIINAKDLLIMMGSCGVSLPREPADADEDTDADPKPAAYPFDYKNYPDPWPLVPFSSNPPTLQSQIPFHLLPETLIVHDPFRLLHARTPRDKDVDWTSVDDVTHKYKLDLTVDSIKENIALERSKIEEITKNATPVTVGISFYRSDERDSGDSNPTSAPGNAYKITVPPPPPPPISVPEAHLFLSPAHTVGSGNHSRVYHAEWDLPRSVFSKPKICNTCLEEAARKIISDKAGSTMDNNSPGSNNFFNGNLDFREARTPKITFAYTKFSFNYADLEKSREQIHEDHIHTLEDEKTTSYVEYSGSMDAVHITTVPWYDPASSSPPPCSHFAQSSVCGSLPESPPPTAQVSVVAKLSLRGDNHMKREAANYQRFGMQFSQHWTGYTLATPLQDPTPMGAITPVFYGYYSKEDSSDSDQYFSPILLLEDCGTPIEPDKLDFDDRQECAALVLRLHFHRWTQGSFWPRNILMQLGDHADFPLMKSANDRRFRLIDFGRAKCLMDAQEADYSRSDNLYQKYWDDERFNEKSAIGRVLEFHYPT